MNIVFDAQAERDLDSQLAYLIGQGAAPAARKLETRITTFLEHTVAAYPRAGTYVGTRDLWETWVPDTRIVIWYRFTTEELQIVRVWHTSQNRNP